MSEKTGHKGGDRLSKKPDITSLASYQVLKPNAARLSVATGPTSLAAVTGSLSPSAWSTPVLTEIPYTPELRQLFLDEEKPPAHAPIGHNAGPPLHDDNDLSIQAPGTDHPAGRTLPHPPRPVVTLGVSLPDPPCPQ